MVDVGGKNSMDAKTFVDRVIGFIGKPITQVTKNQLQILRSSIENESRYSNSITPDMAAAIYMCDCLLNSKGMFYFMRTFRKIIR